MMDRWSIIITWLDGHVTHEGYEYLYNVSDRLSLLKEYYNHDIKQVTYTDNKYGERYHTFIGIH